MNIVLVGFRGTGKGAIRKAIARYLKMKFFDTDKEAEKRAKKKVAQIFEESGEQGFRKLEKEVVADISSMKSVVIATGGGVVLDEKNIENLRRDAAVVLLRSSPEEIYKRIKGDKRRPRLTQTTSEFDEIILLLGKRENQYVRTADIEFNTDFRSIEKCAEMIIKKLGDEGYIDEKH